MVEYQIVIRDKQGNILGEFTEWKGLQFSDQLNDYGSCRFKVPVTSVELQNLVSLRRYEVLVKRNGTTVWSGEQVARYGELKANSPQYLTIESYTFLEMLNSRYTDSFIRYDNTDQGAILKDLVDTSQAKTEGDLGFTFGTVETTVSRDREYSNYNIMDAFINMSKVINGPDFYITHDKQINIVARKGIDKSKQVILEWKTNLESVMIDEDFVNPANQAILLGSGFGGSQLTSTATDTSARAVYKLRQQRASEIDVSEPDTLFAKAQAIVRKYKQPLLKLTVNQLPETVPSFGTISLGDTITIRIREGVYNISNKFRVYGYEVRVDDDNKESISYLVGMI